VSVAEPVNFTNFSCNDVTRQYRLLRIFAVQYSRLPQAAASLYSASFPRKLTRGLSCLFFTVPQALQGMIQHFKHGKRLKNENRLAIWMDDAHARLMVIDEHGIITGGDAYIHGHGANSSRDQKHAYNTNQRQQTEFYKQLSAGIAKYSQVLLFGPADAKTGLFNYLGEDRRFAEIKIEVRSSGKLTENQQHDFVRAFFPGR
jgi:hypothetical protein